MKTLGWSSDSRTRTALGNLSGGGVSERPKERASKAREGQPSAGSNPAATASLTRPNAGPAATWARQRFLAVVSNVVSIPDWCVSAGPQLLPWSTRIHRNSSSAREKPHPVTALMLDAHCKALEARGPIASLQHRAARPRGTPIGPHLGQASTAMTRRLPASAPAPIPGTGIPW